MHSQHKRSPCSFKKIFKNSNCFIAPFFLSRVRYTRLFFVFNPFPHVLQPPPPESQKTRKIHCQGLRGRFVLQTYQCSLLTSCQKTIVFCFNKVGRKSYCLLKEACLRIFFILVCKRFLLFIPPLSFCSRLFLKYYLTYKSAVNKYFMFL